MNQEKCNQYLQGILESGRVPHALCFAGGKGAEKERLITDFANKLVETPLDIHRVLPEGTLALHTIESLRALIDGVFLPPYGNKKKVFIVEDAERMLPASSNALLKTLEEPSSSAVIILLIQNERALLPTIRSRVQLITLDQEKEMAKEVEEKWIWLLSNLNHLPIHSLLEEVQLLAASLDEMKKELEVEEIKGIEKSTVQKHMEEKILEGKASLSLSQRLLEIYSLILYWYRDLQLLKLAGEKEHIYHKNSLRELESRVALSQIPPLEPIFKHIEKLKQMIERSGSLKNCFESFFLQLKRLESLH